MTLRDPDYFRNSEDQSDPIVLLNLILGWFTEKSEYSRENLTKIEKSLTSDFSKHKLNEDQIITLAGLILVMAVQSYSNTYFIDKMQSLSVSAQHALKDIIQSIMDQLTTEMNETHTDKVNRDLQARLREILLDLDESNLKLQEQSDLVDKLTRQNQENLKYKEEYSRVKDKVQELEFISEKYSKTEQLLKKYKARLDEFMPLKGEVKELEGLLLEKDNVICGLQEELRKDGLLKRMMRSYKDQITKLETSNAALQVDKDGLASQILELSGELGHVKVQSQEQINLLNQKIIEMSKQESDYQREEEFGHPLDELHRIGQLNDKLSSSRDELSQLSDKLIILENQLDDMTRLKNAFEHDYRRSHEMHTRVQMENHNLVFVSLSLLSTLYLPIL